MRISGYQHSDVLFASGASAVQLSSGAGSSAALFDPARPDKSYALRLALPLDHAVAELLRARAQMSGSSWKRPKHNGHKFNFKCGACVIPSGGLLDFTYVRWAL